MSEAKKFLSYDGLVKLSELIKGDTIHHMNGITVDIDYSGGTLTTTGLDDKTVDGTYTINGYNYIFRVNRLTNDGNVVVQEVYMPCYPLTQEESGTRGTFGWFRYGTRSDSSLQYLWTTWESIKLTPISDDDIDDIIDDVFGE